MKSNSRRCQWLLAAVVLTLLAGCASTPSATKLRVANSIDFNAHDGTRAFRLLRQGGGIALQGPTESRLAFLQLKEESLFIEDAAGQPIARILPPSEDERGFRVVAPDGASKLIEVRREPDGDLRVLDPDGGLIYQIKHRDYGFKVVDAAGKAESRIRVKVGKVSVREPSGVTFLSTRESVPAESVAMLSLEKVRFEIAAGLAVALAHWQ